MSLTSSTMPTMLIGWASVCARARSSVTASDGLTVIGETNALSMGLDGPASPVPVLKSPAGAVMQGDRSESAGCRSRTAATAAVALAKEVDELSSMLLRPASE